MRKDRAALADVPADTAHSPARPAGHAHLSLGCLFGAASRTAAPAASDGRGAGRSAYHRPAKFRAETFRELRHLAETSGHYMPSCYVVRLYDWDTDMGRLQEMRGRLDGPACPEAPQQVQQLRSESGRPRTVWCGKPKKVLESDPEISPCGKPHIEKLDAELQTLGWLARFPEKKSIALISTGSRSTNTVSSRASPRRAVPAGRKSLPRAGRTARTHDRTAILRRRSVRVPADGKGPKPEKTCLRSAAERDRFYKERANRTTGFGSADKAVMPVFG